MSSTSVEMYQRQEKFSEFKFYYYCIRSNVNADSLKGRFEKNWEQAMGLMMAWTGFY